MKSELDYLKFTSLKENIRIDKYITEFLNESDEEITRSEVKKSFDENKVYVNDKLVKPSYLLKLNDEIKFLKHETITEDIIPENIPLNIVYEDDDIMVINKPSGMVVHPAPGHYTNTLVNAIMYHSNELSDVNGIFRPGIVHRIDKDTSGLLIICKNNYAHNKIALQLKNKTSKREYYAICYGTFEHSKGIIDAPIGRDNNNRQKQAVIDNGKHAVTHFEVLENLKGYSLVKCVLETGRTHQIRVHMAYINHPVLGDPIYGPNKNVTKFGQFLHAKTIGFYHPRTLEWMEFDSEVPKEFLDKLNELRYK